MRRPSPFSGLIRSFGLPVTVVIAAIAAVWMIVLILLPQMIMLERSLWTLERPADAFEISRQIDELYNDIDLLGMDRATLEAAEPSPQRDGDLAALQEEIALKETRIAELEATETEPRKVYSLSNYTRMSALHVYVFVRTIVASLLVTLLAFVVCYPVAYTLAHLATPVWAAILMLGLVVPYAINELLRVFAWLMILDYNGVANTLLTALGGEPIDFVGSSAGVFLAMVYAYVLFMVFPIYNTIQTLDRNQIEAARDLGAPLWKIHARIVLPHAKPGIAVGCIMTFMLAAGSYSVPQIVSRGQGGDWFSQLIYRQFFESFSWNIGAAYAFTLLLACIAFIFAMMALFKVGVRDIAR
ncbi:ABC transporter permease [Marinivivus vitaminiproducens]|uniref:ABC transporter permease n=1 Tax=Marinivivus vitaminiproducens TaxID=3035935 RepID=UPI0027A3C951|nr:ABC transporter permease [Geminicoccaceae bacterium SCSIO 64248]